MNLALLRGEYTVAIIPAVRLMKYVAALEVAHKIAPRLLSLLRIV